MMAELRRKDKAKFATTVRQQEEPPPIVPEQKEEQGRHARRKSEFHPQLKSLDSIAIIQEAAAAKKFKPGGFTVGKQIKNVEAVPLEVSPESSPSHPLVL